LLSSILQGSSNKFWLLLPQCVMHLLSAAMCCHVHAQDHLLVPAAATRRREPPRLAALAQGVATTAAVLLVSAAMVVSGVRYGQHPWINFML
jgi:hypothetical protein